MKIEEITDERFAWLKRASTCDADVEIKNDAVLWKRGVWKGGAYEGGDGFEDGR